MSAPQILALSSSVPGSGKTTIREFLQINYGYIPISFASTLKNMISCMLEDLGIECGYEYIQNCKHNFLSDCIEIDEEIRQYLNFTPRTMCQTLGTEWGRDILHPNIWILVWKAKAKQVLKHNPGAKICIDDCRFQNEFAAIKDLGGQIWNVKRPNHSVGNEVIAHRSEGALNDFEFDQTLINDSSIDDLYKSIMIILNN